ncbi:bifunctional oligoribonuclease/PAP phosphatase NrnA [Flavobacterium sp. DG1-102-2]|uniref:DHH family phosphoesterase n=1 Tax=Flavobacterium sp. DG1-102-2 TaxID=3081663 RepID=UPI0029495E27|nr:bifunctional oligoribonuclease/PAP phosphatase NrnA [Flavobacterium sp. DG1-102-2]MDV6170091.1 bifunctional oligoribonuclease/PAP phosphatase NrnA [Flavobacterium sp. DG1-102-2]
MMNNEDINGVKQLLALPKKIAIIPHRNPDGDAMGSTLGLYHFLKYKGHDPIVITPNESPDFLAWLPSFNTVRVFEKETESATKILKEADVIFTLDFNVLSRTGDQMEAVLKELIAPYVMIDHHQKPGDYAMFTFSDTSFGSTCEMIYHFIVAMGEKALIDKTIATCLYTGIVTDSGSFRYPSTTGITHRVVADFIDLGIDNTAIHSLLFDNHSHNRVLILARALQNMKVMPAYKTSYTTLSQEELNSFGHSKGDTEGIVNYGLSMKDIVFTAFFTENKDEGIIKISFRSKGSFDVNQYAREHFSGGGHINAAGGRSNESLEATIQKFIATLAHTKID